MRNTEIVRATEETDIKLVLELDGTGKYSINTGCGFLNHMLELFAKHAGFDLTLVCKGDVQVDYHHTVEDVALCLGAAIKQTVGDKKGICRYGDVLLPMDEALVMVALDLSGRSYINYDVAFPDEYKIGDFDTELILEFFTALSRKAELTLHIKKLYGTNAHHVAEAMFKGVARALGKAVAKDAKNPDSIPSSKGSL